jgi:transposase InsO family protein
LSDEIRGKVGKKRIELGRSIEVIHHALKEEGVHLGLSSVYRILKSQYLIKRRSRWKRYHPKTPRPLPLSPGDLVQIDTIHLMNQWKEKIYIYTIIDVYSRTAYARCYQRASTHASLDFLRRVEKLWPFSITCIQSDHGPEFGAHFTRMAGMRHRHSRVRTPNDNAHVERFNRTVQEECLRGTPLHVVKINKALHIYLNYYNTKRHHFSLKFRTPSAILDASSVSKV